YLWIVGGWRWPQRNVEGSMRIPSEYFRDRIVSAVGDPDVAVAIRHRSHRPGHVALRVSPGLRDRFAVWLKGRDAVVLRCYGKSFTGRILKSEIADPDLTRWIQRDAVPGAVEAAPAIWRPGKVLAPGIEFDQAAASAGVLVTRPRVVVI